MSSVVMPKFEKVRRQFMKKLDRNNEECETPMISNSNSEDSCFVTALCRLGFDKSLVQLTISSLDDEYRESTIIRPDDDVQLEKSVYLVQTIFQRLRALNYEDGPSTPQAGSTGVSNNGIIYRL